MEMIVLRLFLVLSGLWCHCWECACLCPAPEKELEHQRGVRDRFHLEMPGVRSLEVMIRICLITIQMSISRTCSSFGSRSSFVCPKLKHWPSNKFQTSLQNY
jgi:hypothetical protein